MTAPLLLCYTCNGKVVESGEPDGRNTLRCLECSTSESRAESLADMSDDWRARWRARRPPPLPCPHGCGGALPDLYISSPSESRVRCPAGCCGPSYCTGEEAIDHWNRLSRKARGAR